MSSCGVVGQLRSGAVRLVRPSYPTGDDIQLAMSTQYPTPADPIQGLLHGFDRVRLQGALRLLQTAGGVATWLTKIGAKVAEFTPRVDGWRQRLLIYASPVSNS